MGVTFGVDWLRSVFVWYYGVPKDRELRCGNFNRWERSWTRKGWALSTVKSRPRNRLGNHLWLLGVNLVYVLCCCHVLCSRNNVGEALLRSTDRDTLRTGWIELNLADRFSELLTDVCLKAVLGNGCVFLLLSSCGLACRVCYNATFSLLHLTIYNTNPRAGFWGFGGS
jgi:hypothetical protein